MQLVQQERQVQLEIPEILAQMVPQGLQACVGLQVQLVQQEPPESRELQVQLEEMEQPELLAQEVQQEIPVSWDLPGLRE